MVVDAQKLDSMSKVLMYIDRVEREYKKFNIKVNFDIFLNVEGTYRIKSRI
jgi:hypothetical protein